MTSADHEHPDLESCLDAALKLLRQSQELNQALLREQQRVLRRIRRQVAGAVVTALIAVVSVAMATGSQQLASGGGGAVSQVGPDRAQLLAMLSDQERAKLEQFETRVQWLSAYMKSNPDFDAGAAVALFLSEVAQNMEAVPKMHSEMQVMNARMAAVPAIVAEMQAINAKMAVMTGAMDSTMGRAGRMFPWMPFSP